MDANIVILIIIILIVFAYLKWLAENKRRAAYHRWVQLHGWSYKFERDDLTYCCYSFLNRLQRGSNRYALDILKGTWEKYPAEAFVFHYETVGHTTSSNGSVSMRTTNHHYLGVVLIKIGHDFPSLQIFPKNIFGKMASALGLGGIKFESVEFSKKFTVRCNDEKFAHDFCHPEMMNYLLANLNTAFEINRNVAVLYKKEGWMKPSDVEKSLVKLCRLRELMPEHLFRN